MKAIPLSDSGRLVVFALVDDEDFESLVKCKWTVTAGYAYNTYRGYMHRLLANAQRGQVVDHRNGKRFDNRRENLRFCTRAQNMWNRGKTSLNKSGYKGVYFCKKTGLWVAQICCNNAPFTLGRYDTPEMAHDAYRMAAGELHGEYQHP